MASKIRNKTGRLFKKPMNMKIAALKLIEKRLLKTSEASALAGLLRFRNFILSRHAGDPRATGKVGMLAQRRRSAENSMKTNNQQTCSEVAAAARTGSRSMANRPGQGRGVPRGGQPHRRDADG